MNKAISLILVLVFALTALVSCSGDSLLGSWEGKEDGHVGILTFNEDGTGSVSIDGVKVDTNWSVNDGKYLTVSTKDPGYLHKFFDNVEFSIDDGELIVKSNGTVAVFKKK